MKNYTSAAVAVLAFGALATLAFAADWKEYGGYGSGRQRTDPNLIPSLCFLDQESVSRTNDGHVSVWTKCLAANEISNIDENSDRGKKLFQDAATKSSQGYIPPIVAIGVVKSGDADAIMFKELVADLNDIDPTAKNLMELNCADKMERHLDTYFKTPSQTLRFDRPSEWKHIVPETAGGNLEKILCGAASNGAR